MFISFDNLYSQFLANLKVQPPYYDRLFSFAHRELTSPTNQLTRIRSSCYRPSFKVLSTTITMARARQRYICLPGRALEFYEIRY